MEKMQNVANDKNWKALIKPSKVDVKTHDSTSIATITAEPLEKGYGMTIGNTRSVADRRASPICMSAVHSFRKSSSSKANRRATRVHR